MVSERRGKTRDWYFTGEKKKMNEVGTSQVERKDEWRVLHGWEEKMKWRVLHK